MPLERGSGLPSSCRDRERRATSPRPEGIGSTRAPEIRLPFAATPVELAHGADAVHAGELATRWVLRLTVLLRALLAVVCMVGPHIPAGE